MTRVDRRTFADWLIVPLKDYRFVHGLIESYGGRIKDYKQSLDLDHNWIMFFELEKESEQAFRAERLKNE
jgi:hypothetical protein